MSTPTVKDMIDLHSKERAIYKKFVSHGIYPILARDVICLFMWLDHLRLVLITQLIPINNPSDIFSLVTEARDVLHCLYIDHRMFRLLEIPLISSLSKDRVHPSFFDSNKVRISKEFLQIFNGIGSMVCDDHLYEALYAYEADVKRKTKRHSSKWWRPMTPPLLPYLLAKPFDPNTKGEASSPSQPDEEQNDYKLFP